MKSLFKPPIQNLLWLASLGCLSFAAWNLWQLRQLSEQQTQAASVAIQLPDAAALQVPELSTYTRLVEAPLFWESRAPKSDTPAVAVVAEPVAPPAELPKGRLVGIVNNGKKHYGLVRGEEKNLSLYQGDQWDGWTIESIAKDRLVLVAGAQKQEVRLLAEFSAPKENQQLAKAKQQAKQLLPPVNAGGQAALAQAQAALPKLPQEALNQVVKSLPAEIAANVLLPILQPASPAQPDSGTTGSEAIAQSPPNTSKPLELAPDAAVSLHQALEARQKLMAERWGSVANQ